MKELRSGRMIAANAALLAAALFTSGCARLHAQSRVNPISSAAYPIRETCPLTYGSSFDTRTGAIDLDCFTFPEVSVSFSKLDKPLSSSEKLDRYGIDDRSKLAYSMATVSPVYRNRLTSILIKQSDDVCVQELGRLTANEATTNAALSIVGTGLSTAASIVSGELAKSILAGGSTLAGASRDHINVHVYRNTIAQAVSQVIASERKTRFLDIQKRYQTPLADWSIDDAIRDVNVYHAQCSFFKGLELLLKAADNNTDLQSYRRERLRQTAVTRIDENIGRLTQTIDKLGTDDPNVPALKSDLAKLVSTRAALDDPDPSRENNVAPPDPAD